MITHYTTPDEILINLRRGQAKFIAERDKLKPQLEIAEHGIAHRQSWIDWIEAAKATSASETSIGSGSDAVAQALTMIDDFDRECQAEEHTDIDAVWSLLHQIHETLSESRQKKT